jgi:hypothetical protein
MPEKAKPSVLVKLAQLLTHEFQRQVPFTYIFFSCLFCSTMHIFKQAKTCLSAVECSKLAVRTHHTSRFSLTLCETALCRQTTRVIHLLLSCSLNCRRS